uniref:Uncharacterized protein n=1 Tax=Anguilla anguilla TaxID=7936 RepID=A0A0E9PEU9_ANGAN
MDARPPPQPAVLRGDLIKLRKKVGGKFRKRTQFTNI